MIKEEFSPNEPGEVWAKYGLKESPYSTLPMRLVGILPIQDVFCGRKEEVIKLKKIINSSNSTRTLIVGNYGVGKTTFANYVRWNLCMKKGNQAQYLTTSSEIKVQKNWDATKFLLSTLSTVYNSSIIFDWKNKGLSLPSLSKIKSIVDIEKQTSMQGSVAGIGAGYSESKSNPPQLSPELLESLFVSICQEIKKCGKELILHYDNVENIDQDKLGEIFKSIREYLQIEGLHTLFLGPPNIISVIETHGQINSIFSQHVVLDPLSDNDVIEILKRRCDSLRDPKGNYLIPFEESTVRNLYKKLNNIRFTFKVLEDATLATESKAPCKITIEDIHAVQEAEKKNILSFLTDTQVKIISALLDKEKVNQKELSDLTKIGITNLTRPVEELMQKGLIVVQKSQQDKRFKYIRLSDNSYLKLFFTSEEMQDASGKMKRQITQKKLFE